MDKTVEVIGHLPARPRQDLHYAVVACTMTFMARSVTIRDVPEDACAELASRAAATGRSLQEYLRMQLVGLASRPDPEALVTRIRERKQRTGSRLPAQAILRHRDADRR